MQYVNTYCRRRRIASNEILCPCGRTRLRICIVLLLHSGRRGALPGNNMDGPELSRVGNILYQYEICHRVFRVRESAHFVQGATILKAVSSGWLRSWCTKSSLFGIRKRKECKVVFEDHYRPVVGWLPMSYWHYYCQDNSSKEKTSCSETSTELYSAVNILQEYIWYSSLNMNPLRLRKRNSIFQTKWA